MSFPNWNIGVGQSLPPQVMPAQTTPAGTTVPAPVLSRSGFGGAGGPSPVMQKPINRNQAFFSNNNPGYNLSTIKNLYNGGNVGNY